MDLTPISVADAAERKEQRLPIVFVDVRSEDDYEAADTHIPGSVRVPPDDIDAHLELIPRSWLVVPYCTDPTADCSNDLARTLLENGWDEVRPLEGGFEAWIAAGLPEEPKLRPQRPAPAERRGMELSGA